MSATKLEKLLIGEVSGVDDPANEIPGWMVAKAAGAPATAAGDSSLVDKIRALVTKGGESTESEIEMTKDELVAVLDERETVLIEKVTAAVSKSVEAPVTGEGATPTPEDPAIPTPDASAVQSLTTEDLQKALSDAIAPYNEILEKTLDRLERVETALAVGARKSLNGQETNGNGDGQEATPTVQDAIGAALKNRGGTPA